MFSYKDATTEHQSNIKQGRTELFFYLIFFAHINMLFKLMYIIEVPDFIYRK